MIADDSENEERPSADSISLLATIEQALAQQWRAGLPLAD
jgi:hypothetical protein